MRVLHRKLLVAGLLTAFATQGLLVYADEIGNGSAQLAEQANEGRLLWLANNCSACHQFHGFGGFLGPDLTNAAQRLPRKRLDEILVTGSLQMPAFHFAPRQIDAIESYLRAMDATGQGQARRIVPPPVGKVWGVIERRLAAGDAAALQGGGAAEAALPEELLAARRGHELFRARCCACHVPLCATPLGVAVAPDPTAIRPRLEPDAIERTLIEGRADRGMPPAGLEPGQRRDVIAFLDWLGAHRDALCREGGQPEIIDLPWWEFR